MSAKCLVPSCKWATEIPSRHIAGCLATWHVYEEHREQWIRTFGDRPPTDPDPRTEEGLRLAISEEIIEGLLNAT